MSPPRHSALRCSCTVARGRARKSRVNASSLLFRHQRKRPYRATGGHGIRDEAGGNAATAPGQHRHVLLALMGISDGWCIDARSRLELPQLLSVIAIERDHFAGELAGKQQSAV